MFDWIADPNAWIALATLTALEIVLGIDNILFITILVNRLPPEQRARARTMGLALAMGTRILLLLSLSWVMGLTDPLFEVLGFEVTGRSLILVGGGLFLIWKSVHEIHNSLEGPEDEDTPRGKTAVFGAVLVQIALIDIVFSLDSVITAVGWADDVAVMVVAVVIAIGVMMFAAGPIGDFVERRPTVRMLAMAFLTLIGVTLIAEGLGRHIPKGYMYFALGFSIAIEMLNTRMQRGRAAVKLHRRLP